MSKQPIAKEESPDASKKTINVSKEDLNWASTQGLISTNQADNLWTALASRATKKPGFDLATLSWYSGAVIVMIAMGWFLGEVWDLFSGGAILATAVAYATFFLIVGTRLWKNEDLRIPGGLLCTLGACMAPLAMYGLQILTGMSGFPDSGQRLLIWGSAIVAGLGVLKFVRFPFLTAPIVVGLWLSVLELANLVLGDRLTGDMERHITLGFGLVMLVGSYLIDRRTKQDFAFWGYLAGATGFWWALTLSDSGSELWKFAYCMINVGLMLLSVLLNRKIFVIYGAVGVVGYLGHLAWTVFADTALFPLALSFLGLGIIFLGIQYHRNRERVSQAIMRLVPDSLKGWLPTSRS